MKLTYSEVTPLLRSCLALEQALVGKGSGTARVRLAANMQALRGHEEAYQAARTSLIKDVVGDVASIPDNDPRAAELSKRLLEIDETEIDVNLWSLEWTAFSKDKLSSQALSLAMPLIKGCEGWGEPDV